MTRAVAHTKMPGKTPWAGRRRPMTRRSGFSTTAPGSQYEMVGVSTCDLTRGAALVLKFQLATVARGGVLGFGGWFWTSSPVTVEIEHFDRPAVLTTFPTPNWNKFGSQWYSDGTPTPEIRLAVIATVPTRVAIYGVLCGEVRHVHLSSARPELMTNMHGYAPEANFISPEAQGRVQHVNARPSRSGVSVDLYLKSCNRCGRFLPINFPNERAQLSFTNHCVASHRRPCSHPGFGRLTNPKTGAIVGLEYGFQLECRFCKKFEVNAAHNPQRTIAQHKEDGTRRRALEVLLEQLYATAPQLRYRHETGRELSEDVYTKFGGRCFKCRTALATAEDMALDHTRPLALLWPLDGTATALCPTHNSEKRDRPPVEFYTPGEIVRLATITGIPVSELRDPRPNMEAIARLQSRLDWFCREFLNSPALTQVQDGKRPADLLIKALQKALNKCPGGAPFNVSESCRQLRATNP